MEIKEVRIGRFYLCDTEKDGIFRLDGIHEGGELSGFILKKNNSIGLVRYGEYFGMFSSCLVKELTPEECRKVLQERTEGLQHQLQNFFRT